MGPLTVNPRRFIGGTGDINTTDYIHYHIFVRDAVTCRTKKVAVNIFTTVDDLVHNNNRQLLFNGIILDKHQSLSSAGILAYHSVFLVANLPAGSDEGEIPLVNVKNENPGGSGIIHPAVNANLPPILPIKPSRSHVYCPYFQDDNHSPATWLLVQEATFPMHGVVTSRDKFNHILSMIPPNIISKISNVIKLAADAQHQQPYEAIKEALAKELMPDSSQLFNQYFKSQSIGDLKPSKFLTKCIADLDSLQPNLSKDVALLRRFFLSSLPQTTQQILSILPTATLTELAAAADKMLEITGSSASKSIHAITKTSPIPPTSSNTELALCNAIALLTDKIASLDVQLRSSDRRQNGSRGNSPATSRQASPSRLSNNATKTDNTSGTPRKILCRYHFKFREAAQYCCVGCEWGNLSPTCKLLDTCTYHNRFRTKAFLCLPGCRFYTAFQDQQQPAKNE